ncbi:hypothetical protein PR202_ga21213 [Eleusine coracana subsp. coracana]|uniref:Uncharacterized protein n=1 Tax=Eleusine coracana subsp. coracana TaxID=191504 RepID=A0AAV5CZ39_ELECO|nr:hypothetical protein PR202_ga21213 [Eleusine coracana subsp. coracana]
MDMNSELWMLWATIAVVLIYYLSTPRRDPCAARQPPGPRPLPLIGNLLDLRHGHLHHTLAHLARVHGPVMRLKLGITTAVIISSRDAARQAFTRHDRRLAARAVPDATRALGSSERSMVWLPSSDPQWKTPARPRDLSPLHPARPRRGPRHPGTQGARAGGLLPRARRAGGRRRAGRVRRRAQPRVERRQFRRHGRRRRRVGDRVADDCGGPRRAHHETKRLRPFPFPPAA